MTELIRRVQAAYGPMTELLRRYTSALQRIRYELSPATDRAAMAGTIRARLAGIHSNQQGFTLVELLVVVVILGALIGVVIPNFTGLLAKGSTESKTTELRTVQTIVDVYMAENRVTAVTAGTITPANYSSGVYASYFRAAPKCNHTVATTGAVTQDSSGQPSTCQ